MKIGLGIPDLKVENLLEMNSPALMARIELFVPESRWKTCDLVTKQFLLGFV